MDRDTIVYNTIWGSDDNYSQKPAKELSSYLEQQSNVRMTCLDLCARGGRNTLPLLQNGHLVTVVDKNEVSIGRLRRLRESFDNLTVMMEDARDFILSDSNMYDLIIVFDAIHHFTVTSRVAHTRFDGHRFVIV